MSKILINKTTLKIFDNLSTTPLEIDLPWQAKKPGGRSKILFNKFTVS